VRGIHLILVTHSLTRAINSTFSGYASDICTRPLPPSPYSEKSKSFTLLLPTHTARTFPVNGKFIPPQRELYAALLATQKALVRECTVVRGHSLDMLHRRSVDLLRAELERVGLPCAGTVLERVLYGLYPHHLTHPIGISESPTFFSAFLFKHFL